MEYEPAQLGNFRLLEELGQNLEEAPGAMGKLPLDTPNCCLFGTGAVARHLQGACQWKNPRWSPLTKTGTPCCSLLELVQMGGHPWPRNQQGNA